MRRNRQAARFSLLSPAILSTLLTALPIPGHSADIDIPYQKFVLDNGLTLIVHEDRKAPLVAVDLWYHVGSKNEKPGQTGFAHLFEHLMFNGSEHFDDEYFRPFEKAGATDQNGTTSNDRTNYFATVPTPALDMALWMESDRMAHLLPAIDQAKLDEQRGVVKNEKRQGEDRPFGKVWAYVAKNTYPAGHPYSWLPIGSMEDLDAAKLDDVHAWFKQYYGPNNAVLVIAGDIDAQTAKQRVEHFFGSIPPGPALQQADAWIAKRSEEQRATLQDRVPNARVYLVWNTPRAADLASARLDLVSDLLAGDASSLLNKRLVQEKKLATHIDAANFNQELAGQFWIIADVAPGVEPLRLEREIRAALAEFEKQGPTPAALARAQLNYRATVLRRIEKIGSFGGKADILASGQVFAGDPAYYQRELREVAATTPAQLRDLAHTWLDEGVYVLHVVPQPALKAGADTVDRSRVPDPGPAPDPNVPAVQRARLANGMQLVLLRRPDLPLVELEWQLPAGRNIDGWQHAGTSNFVLDMLLEGNGGQDSAAIAAQIRDLGAEIETYTHTDSAGVRLSALKENIDASAALFARLIRQPDFPGDAVDRLRGQTLARIGREENDGARLAQRVLPRLVFGIDSPDASPLSDTGRREVIAAIDREQLQGFHQRWFNPARTTLIAVGDITLQQLQQLAERNFTDAATRAADGKDKSGNARGWPTGSAPIPDDGAKTRAAAEATLYFIDNPGSSQASISAALAMPAGKTIDMDALTLANQVFGGAFTSRLNLNLREDKHWSYGTRSAIVESRGRQLWLASGNVQIDKTGPALQEMRREMQEISSAKRPIAEDEMDKVREQRIRQLPGAYDTNRELLEAISKNVQLQRADDYPSTEGVRLRALNLDAIRQQAAGFAPDTAVWLAVGDKQKILPQLQQLGWGSIVELDKQGEPIGR